MDRANLLISIIVVLLGMSLVTVTQAQTPIQKAPQDLTLMWLYSLAVSPASRAAGTRFTGTVKLMRAAIADTKVDLGLAGSKAVEGAGFLLDGSLGPRP